MLARPQEAATEFRSAMVQVLKHLNRDEMEEVDVPGLEVDELRNVLSRSGFPVISRAATNLLLDVLVRNRLAVELSDPRYAWTRGRVVTNRFVITREGKEFLLRSIERVGRI